LLVDHRLVNEIYDKNRIPCFAENTHYCLQIIPSCPNIQHEGIFCDISGTLVSGKEINSDIFLTLKELEGQGKKINLWTGGTINQELTDLLENNQIYWPLLSKYDFEGQRVATAFDDENQEMIFKKYGISVTEFQQVI
jgi:hypothetical protein